MQYKEMTYATVRGAGHMVSVPCDMMLAQPALLTVTASCPGARDPTSVRTGHV